jgi:hypothetical protein
MSGCVRRPCSAGYICLHLGVLLLLFILWRGRDLTLGGGWIVSKPYEFPRAGFVSLHSELQRKRGWTRVTVARDADLYIYIGDDCAIFLAPWGSEHALHAACGDNPPVLIAHTQQYPSRQQLESDPVHINGIEIPRSVIKERTFERNAR